MRLIRRAAVLGAAAMLAAGLVSVVSQLPAEGHGTPMSPGSRTFLCWKDGLSPEGDIQPHNPACAAAVQQGGANPLYNWFSVLRSDAAGRTVGFIPDGQLCSGGNATFAAYNLARNDWPLTHLTAGAPFDFKYSNWAHHPGTFYFYVTKDSWSPTRALAWSDLETQPFLTVTNPPQNGGPGTNDGHYYFSGQPAVRQERAAPHLLALGPLGQQRELLRLLRRRLRRRQRPGHRGRPGSENARSRPVDPAASSPPRRARPRSVRPPGPPPHPPPGGDCMAVYRIIGAWTGGFQAEVEIMNHSARTYGGWTASWAWPSAVRRSRRSGTARRPSRVRT